MAPKQCCGSGSAWIRNFCLIRIRNYSSGIRIRIYCSGSGSGKKLKNRKRKFVFIINKIYMVTNWTNFKCVKKFVFRVFLKYFVLPRNTNLKCLILGPGKSQVAENWCGGNEVPPPRTFMIGVHIFYIIISYIIA